MGMDFIGTTAVIGVLIPIFAMTIGLVIALFAIQRSYKNRQLEHELRMAALEKGYDIPAMPQDKHKKPNYPFAWPFVFIGFGLALILIYIFNPHADSEALSFGLIIFLIGGGLFASRFYGVRKEEMSETERAAKNTWTAPAKAVEAKPATQVASEFPKDEEKS